MIDIRCTSSATGKLAHSYDIPAATGEAIVSPDGAKAYVSCPAAGTIEVLDLATWQLEKPLVLTKGADGLAFAN